MTNETREISEMVESTTPSNGKRSATLFSFAPLWVQILLGLVLGSLIGLGLGYWAVGQVPADLALHESAARSTNVGWLDRFLNFAEHLSPGPTDRERGAAAATLVSSSWIFLILDLLGDLFLNGLKLIVVPLVTSSIVVAVMNLSGESNTASGSDRKSGIGRLGVKTLAYYMSTSMLAILVGLVLVNVFTPGVASGPDGPYGILVGETLDDFATEQAAFESKTDGKTATDFLDVFRQMVPPNVIKAAGEGQLLGLIVVSMLVGWYLGRMKSDAQPVLKRFAEGVYEISLKVTELVMRFAPIGVLGLIAATMSEQFAKLWFTDGLEDLALAIGKFSLIAVGALLIHFAITMPLMLVLVARVNPIRHYWAMLPALTTAFSTASSSSTLPITMECVEERAGVSRRTTSFVLPLGATVNMDGTALYECVAAIFICQAFGVELSIAQQFMIVMTALFTSIGVAGVPSASLVAILVILQSVQNSLPEGALPEGVMLTAGMGLLLFVDRLLDMCRTAVNVFSDSVGAVVIARSEGETPLGSE